MIWQLKVERWQWAYNEFERHTFTQEADPLFTAECLDILLADKMVESITLTRGDEVDYKKLAGRKMVSVDNDGDARTVEDDLILPLAHA